MRLFTLLVLICPIHFLSAQNSEMLASGTYTSFADAMFGREPSAGAMVNSTVTSAKETTVEPVNTVVIENATSSVKTDTHFTRLAEKPVREVPVERTITRKGVGVWVDNSSKENINHCYALHRSAPIGSVIDLKNPMNGRIVSVKIIGKLPSIEQYKGVTILVSAAAARKLHILDRKFIVNLLMPESLVYGSK